MSKISDDDVAREHRRVALSEAIHEAIGTWAERFRDEPEFEPDSEMCFCMTVVLGCFIAQSHDQTTREYLRHGTRKALDGAIAGARDLQH